jgi:TonB family protein
MKSCPLCQRAYEDDAMSFCLEDGTPLKSAFESSYDEGATVKIPAARLTSDAPTEVLTEQAATEVMPEAMPKPTQRSPAPPAPGKDAPQSPASTERKPNALPWILGTALVLGLSAIAVALIVTRGSGTDNSQTAQNTVQTDNSALSANVSTPQGSSMDSTGDAGTNPQSLATPTPVRNASPTTTPKGTLEQPAATPKPTPTQKPTPQPTPEATPTPRPRPSGPISGGVLNGKAISKPAPPYPAIAKAARASGTVVVQVLVDESGRVTSARAVSGHPLLQQSAVQAAYQARFSPTLLSGQPVKVTGTIIYNFVAQ